MLCVLWGLLLAAAACYYSLRKISWLGVVCAGLVKQVMCKEWSAHDLTKTESLAL
jgi:hypothetical protein